MSGGDENKSTGKHTNAIHTLFSFLFVFFTFLFFSCHILFSIHFSVAGLKLTDVLVSELIIKFVAASYKIYSTQQQTVIFWVLRFYCLMVVMAFCCHLRAGKRACGNLMHSFKNVK